MYFELLFGLSKASNLNPSTSPHLIEFRISPLEWMTRVPSDLCGEDSARSFSLVPRFDVNEELLQQINITLPRKGPNE